jgi:menaquinone-specific isochorismate synthase
VTTRLTVRTSAVDDPKDLLAHLDEPTPVAWVRHGEGLVGWGEAARFEMGPDASTASSLGSAAPAAGLGEARIPKAVEAFAAWCETVDVVDEVGEPGTGPVAFAAFTFDALSTGSVLTVPRVVLGRRDGRAWMTVAGETQPMPASHALPAPRPAAGAADPSLDAVDASGRIRYAGGALAEVGWLEAVAAAVRDIADGQLDKVVLARDVLVWSDTILETRVLARRLSFSLHV